MATPYVCGPGLVYVGVGPGNTALFLGTCEVTPEIDIQPAFEPFFNDLGGRRKPFDMSYDGEDAMVAGVFNRFNESTYAILADRAGPGNARGLAVPGEQGSLMQTENLDYELWVAFPYYNKPQYAAQGMPPGYHFPSAYLFGPDKLSPLGTIPTKRQLIFHCLRYFTFDVAELAQVFPNIPQVLTPNINLGYQWLYDTAPQSFQTLPAPN